MFCGSAHPQHHARKQPQGATRNLAKKKTAKRHVAFKYIYILIFIVEKCGHQAEASSFAEEEASRVVRRERLPAEIPSAGEKDP